jgi:hypothetical protein
MTGSMRRLESHAPTAVGRSSAPATASATATQKGRVQECPSRQASAATRRSYFAKKGGGAIYQRHIHYGKASEIDVTRRDLVHAECSLKKSDCYRHWKITDIGEPVVVVCRHRSCHQCRHDHKDEVCGDSDCIDLDFARCKEDSDSEAHSACRGAPHWQERALTAMTGPSTGSSSKMRRPQRSSSELRRCKSVQVSARAT